MSLCWQKEYNYYKCDPKGCRNRHYYKESKKRISFCIWNEKGNRIAWSKNSAKWGKSKWHTETSARAPNQIIKVFLVLLGLIINSCTSATKALE